MSYSNSPKYLAVLITLLLSLQLTACNNGNPEGSEEPTGTEEPAGTENSTSTGENLIHLSWTAPLEREDNQPISLSEIAGYKVYYGTEENAYSHSVDISDGAANGHTIENLSSGIYYLTLTTYDTAGRESKPSEEIRIIV
jgi:hypothetical protein